MPSLFVLAQWFWRRFLNLVNVFPLFLLLSPPGKGHGPSVEQPWISFTCQVWLKLTLWFCRIRFLKILTLYFRYFVIIFPWKRTCSFIWANLEFPFPKEALCQVWLKSIQWFRRRSFVNFVIMHGSGEENFLILSLDFLFCNNLTLEKGGPFIWKNWNSHHPMILCAKFWLKLTLCFWKRRWKCGKFTDRQIDRRTDKRQSYKLTWAFSSGELIKLKEWYLETFKGKAQRHKGNPLFRLTLGAMFYGFLVSFS